MTHLFIQLAQSVTGAVITIVALLLVAAIIGYVTAWFYAKSVYTPIIKRLEAEKADLQKQVAGLKDDITKLEAKIEKLNQDIAKLENEIAEKNKLITEKDKLINERDKQITDLKNPKK
jgi:peptidoglycan hydrolase CwlO-like protein